MKKHWRISFRRRRSRVCLPALAQTQWDVTKTMHIGGEGAWDYVTVDAATHRLFVTRTTHTMVIDAETGKTLGDIPGQKRSHGTAIVPAVNRGFITDGGGTGAIVVFDLKTYATLGTLATMPDSDGIIYDKAENLIFAVSGDGSAADDIQARHRSSKRQDRSAHRARRRAGVPGLR